MFVVVDTNGANQIIINVPLEGAEKSLPTLAKMLENNAVFICKGWNEFSLKEATMHIHLGDTYRMEHEQELVVTTATKDVPEDFNIAAPEVMVSNKKALDALGKTNTDLRNEVTYLKSKIDSINGQLHDLQEQHRSLQEERDNLQEQLKA